jgi:phosphatidylglycerophosphatase A
LSPDTTGRPAGERLALLVASGFGSGLAPFATGTVGSAVAVLLILGAESLSVTPAVYALLGAGWAALSVATAGVAARAWGESDPARVTIDEVAGMWVTFLWVPVGGWSLVLGFLLFRLFDVIKPYPARQLERLPGGWGITADDLVAGVYAMAVLQFGIRVGWLAGGV